MKSQFLIHMKANSAATFKHLTLPRIVLAFLAVATWAGPLELSQGQSESAPPPSGAQESSTNRFRENGRRFRSRNGPGSEAGSTNRESAGFSGRRSSTNDVIDRIRDEGFNRSQVTQTLSYLSDVIGPRLTGSPNMKRANDWTREKLASWGLTNSHLEGWGPFGRGWSLKSFSAQIIEPQTIPLIGCPAAWSPGFDKPLVADVVYLDVKTNTDLEKYKGKLQGKIVLSGAPREVRSRFDPLSSRLNETNLLQLANAPEPRTSPFRFGPPDEGGPGRFAGGPGRRGGPGGADEAVNGTNTTRSGASPDGRGGPRGRFRPPNRNLSFLAKEGAALVIAPSFTGDGGTFFVTSASVPTPDGQGPFSFTNTPRAWSTNAPSIPPQVTLAIEDYNRLVRMIQLDEKLKMAADLKVEFHDQDLMAYNTVAEIPGSDLKEEIVMLGAHLDSWHSGTGATDNGAGVAATMEAVRILTAIKAQPRRTIRIGLWSGEEQGLFGSKAYVSNHFAYYRTVTNNNNLSLRSPKDAGSDEPEVKPAASESSTTRKLNRQREYEKLSVYFNLDNGAGKIRGIHMQGNEAVRPLFRRWLEPFRDLGAETLTISNTGSTDHISFDGVGLPGFQFIQDPLDYSSRTHHSNEDVFDRIQPDDLKQAAVIIAAFAYNAANEDQRLPRKPTE
jgi:carboxypeptidase Q